MISKNFMGSPFLFVRVGKCRRVPLFREAIFPGISRRAGVANITDLINVGIASQIKTNRTSAAFLVFTVTLLAFSFRSHDLPLPFNCGGGPGPRRPEFAVQCHSFYPRPGPALGFVYGCLTTRRKELMNLTSFHFNESPCPGCCCWRCFPDMLGKIGDHFYRPAIHPILRQPLDAGTIKYVGGTGSEPCVLPDSELSGQRVPASWSVWTPAHLKERDPNPARQCRPDLSDPFPFYVGP